MSALVRFADSRRTCCKGREVPGSDICTAANSTLLDHLVGTGEQSWRDLDAEHLSGCQIDDEVELGWLHHRQVGWLGAFENAAGIDANLAKNVREIGPVAHQAADFREFA